MDQTNYYAQLEQGARYLASLATDDGERSVHLGWANRYYRLRLDSLEDMAEALVPAA